MSNTNNLTTLAERVEASAGLLPCPFCGSKRVVVERVLAGQRFAMCDKCYCVGPERKTNAEAITAWNTRARSETPDDEEGE